MHATHRIRLPQNVAIIGLLLLCNSGCGSKTGTPSKQVASKPHFVSVDMPAAHTDLNAWLQPEVKKAKAAGLKPFVQFYAEWCGPCKRLRASLDDPAMIDAFEGTYIIRLNLDDWKDKLADAGFPKSPIPVFFEMNDQARPTGRKIDGGAWGEDIPANMAPPLKKFFHASAG